MRSPLDRLWEWAADHIPSIRNASTEDSSSHIHHALVCVFIGALGAATALAFSASPPWGFRVAWGLAWLAYVVREARQWHGRRWTWDAVCDVTVPVAWAAPTLVGGERSLVALLVGSAAVGALYTVFRPAPKP